MDKPTENTHRAADLLPDVLESIKVEMAPIWAFCAPFD
jgi:hypothetical protein